MLATYPSKSKVVTVVFSAVAILLLGAHLLQRHPSIPRWQPTSEEAHAAAERPNLLLDDIPQVLPCQKLPGAEHVAVVMRTGATEIQDKLPIHFNTTFRCYQDIIIFSDYAETFMGHEVHDVLASMDQTLKETNADFELYMRLQRSGRESLLDGELSGKASFEGSKSGKADNPGWVLDKWKWLPMMNETLQLMPGKKWYVFVESDSYVVWSNMLQWLEELDHTKPHYYGSEVQIGPDIFAHGGSVVVMSESAIELGAQYYADNRREWDIFTDGHWAGDCVLGKLLREAGRRLEWAWPMFQGGHPEKMDFTELKGDQKKLWCAPSLSYHHFTPREMQSIWEFEQSWIQSRLDKVEASTDGRGTFWEDYSDILQHRDVFRHFVWPRIPETGQAGNWNNESPNILDGTAGREEGFCRHVCEENEACLQYSTGPEGCSFSTQQVMLGGQQSGYESGWMLGRIEKWMERLDNCTGSEEWTIR